MSGGGKPTGNPKIGQWVAVVWTCLLEFLQTFKVKIHLYRRQVVYLFASRDSFYRKLVSCYQAGSGYIPPGGTRTPVARKSFQRDIVIEEGAVYKL